MMIHIEIPLPLVSWRSHAGFGNRSFNPRYLEKEQYQHHIKSQYSDKDILDCPISVTYQYYVRIPKNTSKKNRTLMLEDQIHPTKRKDLDNLDKFLSDCLTGIVWKDDSLVVEKYSRKYYATEEFVVIKISPNNEIID